MNIKSYLERAIKHDSMEPPVNPYDVVVYRTINIDGQVSHVHAPIMAFAINWSYNESRAVPLTFGRVYDYVILKYAIVTPKGKSIQFDSDGIMQ